jgi:transposase
MMGQLDKTDKLDARGLATLLRNGTLPEVWIPSRDIPDQRELLRLRMTLVGMETRLKNRVHAILAEPSLGPADGARVGNPLSSNFQIGRACLWSSKVRSGAFSAPSYQ